MKVNKQMGNYLLESELGRGNFAVVYLASKITDHDEKKYAIKCVSKNLIVSNPLLVKLLKNEVSIMNQINHPNIMHLSDYFESENNFYLVINYCDGGDLETFMIKNKIAFFSEEESLRILEQIMNGFMVLQKKSVIHRDLKLSNIFVNDRTVIIGDFGFAKTGQEMTQTKLGTPLTMAPEIIEGNSQYTSKADLWSIGVIFYQLLFGKPPFFGLSLTELIANIRGKTGSNLMIPGTQKIRKSTETLLRQLLQEDPQKRITWAEFFRHPAFFEKGRPRGSSGDPAEEIFMFRSRQSCMTDNDSWSSRPRSSEEIRVDCSVKPDSRSEKSGSRSSKSGRSAKSAIQIEQIMKLLGPNELEQENAFRYSHELNKLSFLMNASQFCFNEGQRQQKLKTSSVQLFIASVLLYQKAMAFARDIRTSLLRRENRFGLIGFSELVSSTKFEFLLDLFSDFFSKSSIVLKMLENDQSVQDAFTTSSSTNLLQSELSLTEVQEKLKKIDSDFYKQNFSFEENDAQLEPSFVKSSIFIALGTKLLEMFPYWIETRKFNWNLFVKNYENMELSKLIQIVRCLHQDVIS